MKTCVGCKYADWQKTKANKLHPSGDGRCRYPWTCPPIPAAFYFINSTPKPSGGSITRKNELKEHCPYWNPGEPLAASKSPKQQ